MNPKTTDLRSVSVRSSFFAPLSLFLVCSGAAVPRASGQDSGLEDLKKLSEDIPAIAVTRYEAGLSADYMRGLGTVGVPSGFGLGAIGSGPTISSADRRSDYIGTTASFSIGQEWYFDFGFAHGDSLADGVAPVEIIGPSGNQQLPVTYKILDDWYSFGVRYDFPQMRTRAVTAYIKAGIYFVSTDLTTEDQGSASGVTYNQNSKYQDIYGYVGGGVRWKFISGSQFTAFLQGEGEGFLGARTVDQTETLVALDQRYSGDANLDSGLYGVFGRLTVRTQYLVKNSNISVFSDVGIQAKLTLADYFGSSKFNELLWGPYIKLGLRYSF